MSLFQQWTQFCIAVLLVAVLAACSTNSFVPVHDLGNGTTLGQRTVSDPHAFAPGSQRSWMEVCQKKETQGKAGKSVNYVEPCEGVNIQGTQFVSFSPYVNGIATPVLQAGAIVGSSAILSSGIARSGSRTTNTTTLSATGGQGGTGTENSGEVTNNSNNSGIIGDKNHHNEIE